MSERIFHNVEEVLRAYHIPRALTFEEKIQRMLDRFRAAILAAAIREEDDDA